MKNGIKVKKADGTCEDYLHTKVLSAINDAFMLIGESDIFLAEQLADVVTYHLYKENQKQIATAEIFAVIKATLTVSGFEDAAQALSDYHLERRIRRTRIEVISGEVKSLDDALRISRDGDLINKSCWDKSIIVQNLVEKYKVERLTARAIASAVERKIFDMQITRIPISIVKQLVLNETAVMLNAQDQLQTV